MGYSVNKNVYGNYIDEVLVMRDIAAADDYYYAHDHLYSVVALFDDSGAVVERYEYDAYGAVNILSPNYEPRTTSSYGNPYTFTGRRADVLDGGDLKLMYYRARTYDPQTGRFMQRDPYRYIDGMNIYQYVTSNPIFYTDSSGLKCGDCLPPFNPVDNVYSPQFAGMALTPGVSSPSTVAGVQASLGDLRGLLNVLDKIEKYTKQDIPLGRLPYIDPGIAKGLEMIKYISESAISRHGAYLWIKIRYRSCDKCVLSPCNWLLLHFSAYEMTDHERWHPCPNSDNTDGNGYPDTIYKNPSIHDKTEQWRDMIRQIQRALSGCLTGALKNPANPDKYKLDPDIEDEIGIHVGI